MCNTDFELCLAVRLYVAYSKWPSHMKYWEVLIAYHPGTHLKTIVAEGLHLSGPFHDVSISVAGGLEIRPAISPKFGCSFGRMK